MHAFTLETDGFFRRDDAHFFPVGVNYAPANDGDDQGFWTRRSEKEIQTDLAQIANAGLNSVCVSPPVIESDRARAAEFVRLSADAGLAVLMAGSDDCVREGSLPGRAVESVSFSARPGSHVLGHDGLLDPFFQTFLPFAVGCVRARQRAVSAVLGFGGPAGARQREVFLRATLPAARDAGAAGLFWCGWRDDGRFNDGLMDVAGHVKPGLEFFSEFGRSVSGSVPPAPSRDVVGLFAPAESQTAGETLRRLLLARYMLGGAGRVSMMVSGPPPPEPCRQVLISGVSAHATDSAGWLAWVQAGGELFWHGPDLLSWNSDLESLLGARPVNWRSARGVSVEAFGERFTMAHFPGDARAELEPCGASVLAHDQQGLPVLLENRVGRGRVRYVLPIVEDAIVPVAAHPTARDRWMAWYRGLLAP